MAEGSPFGSQQLNPKYVILY
uniref:Uncharacterized protein n=1 Tax=Arundo donax TaxID=35708 RepID=A0A0A9EW48_ARUDO